MRSNDTSDAVGRDPDDQRGDPEAAGPSFWSGYPAAGWWPPTSSRSDAADDEPRPPDDEAAPVVGEWWGGGIASLLIVVGAILFLIPEPATSAAGIMLLGIGVVLWLVDQLS